MSWDSGSVLDAAHRAALSAGKPLVYVCPPAAWAVRPLFAGLPSRDAHPASVAIVPDLPEALDLAGALTQLKGLGPVHVVTGLARAERLLRGNQLATLIATVPDTLELVRRSALKLEGVTRLVLAWPERMLTRGMGDALDTLLAEGPSAQRILLTEDDAALPEFLERHARRAPVARAAAIPEAPTGSVRYAVVDRGRRHVGVRGALDVLNPERAVLWDPAPGAVERWADLTATPGVRLFDGAGGPADVAIAVDLPSAEVLAALRAQAGIIAVLLTAAQLPYLQRITGRLDSLRLASPADQARDQMQALRQGVRERLAAGLPTTELMALDSLFDEHDPALVAAAILAGHSGTAPVAGAASEPAWTRVHVNAGRSDQVRAGDLVGALLNAVGLAKEDIGRIDLKESFTLVDVRAEEAERAVRGLTGITLRGKRIAARLDRR